jgi:hypothetical protein
VINPDIRFYYVNIIHKTSFSFTHSEEVPRCKHIPSLSINTNDCQLLLQGVVRDSVLGLKQPERKALAVAFTILREIYFQAHIRRKVGFLGHMYSLNVVHYAALIDGTNCVYCAVRTESLHKIRFNFLL